MDLAKIIREAVKRDPRSIYRLSKDAGIAVGVLQRFVGGFDIRLSTATKLLKVLGIALRQTKAGK